MHEWGRSLVILGVVIFPMTVLGIWSGPFTGDEAWFLLIAIAVFFGATLLSFHLIHRINTHEEGQKKERTRQRALKILIGAREVLASGWVKGDWRGDAVDASGLWVYPSDPGAVKWTVDGALAKIDSSLGKSPVTTARVIGPIPDDVLAMRDAVETLSKAVSERARPGDYADEPETTHADVLAVFDAAIRDQAFRT